MLSVSVSLQATPLSPPPPCVSLSYLLLLFSFLLIHSLFSLLSSPSVVSLPSFFFLRCCLPSLLSVLILTFFLVSRLSSLLSLPCCIFNLYLFPYWFSPPTPHPLVMFSLCSRSSRSFPPSLPLSCILSHSLQFLFLLQPRLYRCYLVSLKPTSHPVILHSSTLPLTLPSLLLALHFSLKLFFPTFFFRSG